MKFRSVFFIILVMFYSCEFFADTYTTFDHSDVNRKLLRFKPNDINDMGHIVGQCMDSDVDALVFFPDNTIIQNSSYVFNGTSFISIAHPDAYSGTNAYGINNSGVVVGYYDGEDGAAHGFMFDGNVYTTIDYPGAESTYIRDINNNGDMVGYYTAVDDDDNEIEHGFYYDGQEFRPVDVPESYSTKAFGLNDLGYIVGGYNSMLIGSPPFFPTDAFIYDGINFKRIELQEGFNLLSPYRINNEGVIVGKYYNIVGSGDETQVWLSGFIYNGVVFEDISYPGARNTYAYGINNNGDIVGYSENPYQDNGFMLDNSMIFHPIHLPGRKTTQLVAINDNMNIAGTYVLHVTGDFGLKNEKRSFIYDGVSSKPIQFPDASTTIISGINNNGHAVGVYVSSDSSYLSGFMYDDSGYSIITDNKTSHIKSCNINDRDLATVTRLNVGVDSDGCLRVISSGFIFKDGNILSVDYPDGNTNENLIPHGINNNYDIVGSYGNKGFLVPMLGLRDENAYMFIAYENAFKTSIRSINDNGKMIGAYEDGTGKHSFLYNGTEFTLIEYPGAVYTVAVDINNNGDIAGSYMDTAGDIHGFIYHEDSLETPHQADDDTMQGRSSISCFIGSL